MRRLTRRRRAARYCLWGHHGQLVQVGSQTDRYLQRRLRREAEQRLALMRNLRRIWLPRIRTIDAASRFAESMRLLQGNAAGRR